jgi:hypothetical protein
MSQGTLCARNHNRYNISSLSTTSIFSGYFNGKLGTDDIFKPTIRNESLHENRHVNVITVVKFAT